MTTLVPDEAGPEGNPVLAAATEAILSRRLAAGHGDGDEHGRRVAILLEALPDATAALEAAAPLIRADERERIRQMAADLNAVVPQAICNGVTLSTVPFADLIAGEEDEARQWETGEGGRDA